MADFSSETQQLLRRIREGEEPAFEDLFARHRNRLKRVVSLRMDDRLAGRVDASDIVQEAYVEAARRLGSYLEKPEMSFYLWLRWIAKEKVIQEYRRHLGAEKRAVHKQVPIPSPDASTEFMKEILDERMTPTQQLQVSELASCLEQALGKLSEEDRRLILWRHFEELSVEETAELLGISKAAAGKRYLRALEKLRRKLSRSSFP